MTDQLYEPSRESVRKFLEDTENELHYLYEKDPETWDGYDRSNWRSLINKARQGARALERLTSSSKKEEDQT